MPGREPVLWIQMILTVIRTGLLLAIGMGWWSMTEAQMQLFLTFFASILAVVELGAGVWIRSLVTPTS